MKTAFFFSLFTFTLLFLALLFKRVSLEKARAELESLKAELPPLPDSEKGPR